MRHGDLTIRPVTEEEVRELSTWRNDPPYDVYDIGNDSVEGTSSTSSDRKRSVTSSSKRRMT